MNTLPTDKLLAATLRAIGDGVISCDAQGRVTLMNHVAEHLTGWSEQEALGKSLKQVFAIVNETTRKLVEDPVDKVLRMGTVVGMANHTLLLRRDGTEIAIDDSAAPVHDAEGALCGVVLVFRDVTQRREAEWHLELLSASGKALVEATDAGSILARIDPLITTHFADFAMFDLASSPSGELQRHVGQHRVPEMQAVLEGLHRFPPAADRPAHPIRSALETGCSVLVPVVTEELRQALAASSEHFQLFTTLQIRSILAVPVKAEGEVLGVMTFVRDRMAAPFKEADQKVGEELGLRVGLALRRADERRRSMEREALLQAIFDNVPVGILVADPRGKIILGNQELERAVHHRLLHSDSVEGYKDRYVYHGDGRRLTAEEYPLARALLGGEVTRNLHFLYGANPDQKHWVSISGTPIRSPEGDTLGGLVTILDIEDQKRAESAEEELKQQLQRERLRLRTILQELPVGVLVAEPSGKIVLGNREVERIFRHPMLATETVEEHGQWVAFHPDGRQVKGEEYPLPRAMKSGVSVHDEEFLYRRGDGTNAWISISAAALRDEDGEIFGGVVAITDIDARRRETQALADSRVALERSDARFQQLIDRASVGISIGDSEGGLSYINPYMLKVLGYTEQEIESGQVRWSELTPAHYAPLDEHALLQLKETGSAQPYEKAYRAKDGRLVPLLLGATVIPSLDLSSEKQDIAVLFTDLTKQKQAEAALLQTEKLAAVGKLASMVSHEINNPLEAVTNLLYIARQDPSLSQSSRDYLDAADRELARVSQVTAQTLRFHRQSTAATTVRPDALVEEVLQWNGARLVNSNIKVRREYEPEVLFTCFEGDVRQVLNNLIGNAIDAMKTGGHLTVRTRNATRPSTGEPGVKVSVADNGFGMSREVLRHAFDAFYTTKGINGTGLGLWISCRIVHKHRGYIRGYSSIRREHHGTVFTVWLPARLATTAREPWNVATDSLP